MPKHRRSRTRSPSRRRTDRSRPAGKTERRCLSLEGPKPSELSRKDRNLLELPSRPKPWRFLSKILILSSHWEGRNLLSSPRRPRSSRAAVATEATSARACRRLQDRSPYLSGHLRFLEPKFLSTSVCARPSGTEAPLGRTCCPLPLHPKACEEPDICPFHVIRRPVWTGHIARLSGLRRDQLVRATPLDAPEARRPRSQRRLQPSSPRAEALDVPNEPPALAVARRHRRLRAAPPFAPRSEDRCAGDVPDVRPHRNRNNDAAERAIRSLTSSEDSVWTRMGHPLPPFVRRLRLDSGSARLTEDRNLWRVEHLRSFRWNRNPIEPNERLRWPRELPRLQGFDPRGNPPLTCRRFRPARGA
jgi:hypothetical protein